MSSKSSSESRRGFQIDGLKIAQILLPVICILICFSLLANSYVTYAEPIDAVAMQNSYIQFITQHAGLLILIQVVQLVMTFKLASK